MGYTTPTPIQLEAIPPVMAGRDVMGLAQTGTGKTAAFMLPILNRLMQRNENTPRGVRALIIAPTRELAEQIHESALDLGRRCNVRGVTVYGGVSLGPQARKLQGGAELVVACPGRLLDHINQGNVNLSNLETLVLDEADHMFDMGFLPDIKKILSHLPKTRQTLLFSATMPDDIRRLAHEILSDPVTVRIGHTAPAETVSHCIYKVAHQQKTPLLLELLKNAGKGSILIFTKTKHRAKRLAELLAREGHKTSCLQGNLSQRQRQAALDGFRDGIFRIMVATDIAARGIDVTRVGHVVNYDFPDTADAYTHRIGRTGRAEKTGEAHSFVTMDDTYVVRAIERLLGKPLPHGEVEGFDFAATAPILDRELAQAPQVRGRYDNKGRRPGGAPAGGRPAQGQYRGQNSSRPQGAGRDYSRRSSSQAA